MSGCLDLKSAAICNVLGKFIPASIARRLEAWIAGPSAIGSENGMPSSMKSAPFSTSLSKISADVSRSGSPADTNKPNTDLFSALACAKQFFIRPLMHHLLFLHLAGRAHLAGVIPLQGLCRHDHTYSISQFCPYPSGEAFLMHKQGHETAQAQG